jgi:hypothetical protein
MLAFADRTPGILRYYEELAKAQTEREKNPNMPEPEPDDSIEATPTCLKELCIKTVKARELLTSLSGSPSATFRFMWHPRFSRQTSTTFRADIHDFRIQYGGRDNLYRNHECSSSGGRCEGGLSEIDLNTNPHVLGFEEAQDDPVAEH